MESINYSQILILLAQCSLVSILILSLFRLRSIFGMGMLYITLGVFQYFQIILSSTIYIDIYKGFYISPGSFVLFSAGLFSILLVYIKEDAVETRKIIYAILVSNIIVSILQLMFGWNLNRPGVLNILKVPAEIFYINAKITVIGTLLLFADAILIIVLFEFISRRIKNLFLRVFLTMTLVMSFDSLLFSVSIIQDFSLFKEIVISSLISKNIAALFYSILFSIYMIFFDKRKKEKTEHSFNDIFHIMTYRQKFESAIKEKNRTEIESNKKLSESEERYRTLLELAPIGIIVIHIDGKLAYANPYAINLIGASSNDEIYGKEVFNYIHPLKIKETKDRIKKLLNGEKNLYPVENVYIGFDGKEINVEVISSPINFEGENSILVLINDITKQKSIEKQLNKLNKQLERKVKEKTRELNERVEELERFYDATIEREFMMKDLQKEIRDLKKKSDVLAKDRKSGK